MNRLHSISKPLLLWGIFMALLSTPVVAQIPALQDFSGKAAKIEDFTGKGKWLVVMIWASDCHICNREAHQYVDFHMIHSDTDATVLGVSIDGADGKKDAEKFIAKHSIDFPNLIGEADYVASLYYDLTGQYFRGTPTILIYSPKGELMAADAGAVPTELIEAFINKHSTPAKGKK